MHSGEGGPPGDPADHPHDGSVDDFKRIPGIGPASERKLRHAGIHTFEELAARPPEELAALSGSPLGRTKEWARRARLLAAGPSAPDRGEEPEPVGNRQRYETFTVRLLLDEQDDVRRLQVAHVQSGIERTWAGWETAELLDFLVEQAALRARAGAPETGPADAPAPAVPPASQPATVRQARTDGPVRLAALEVVPAASGEAGMMVAAEAPFTVRVTLDLREVDAPEGQPLRYAATFSAKPLGGGPERSIGELQGTAAVGAQVQLVLEDISLPAGTYRVGAVVGVGPPDTGQPDTLAALLDGGMLYVY
jgi:hypothetical protein